MEKTVVEQGPSPAEFRVLLLVSQGHKRNDIAKQLFLSVWTVKDHLQRMYDRYEVRNAPQLIALAYEEGWLPVNPAASR